MLLLVGKTLITLPQVLTYSAGTILIISFLQYFAFNAGTFFLALYYQVISTPDLSHSLHQLTVFFIFRQLMARQRWKLACACYHILLALP